MKAGRHPDMNFRHSRFSRRNIRSSTKALIFFGASLSCFLFMLSWIYTNFMKPPRLPLLWSRSSLHECLSNQCLRETIFADQRLSREDADVALDHMRQFLANRPGQPASKPEPFLDRARHSTCALVGGAPLPSSVSAVEQSRLVDEKENIVIRLNVRVPELLATEGSILPLGTRTDVLFVQRGSLRSFERYIHGWGEGNVTHGAMRKDAGVNFKRRSPLIIYRSECPSRFASCPRAWEALGRSSLPLWMELHLLHYDVEMLTSTLLSKIARKRRRKFRIGSDVPSTGIVAIVAALRVCKEVKVFMFNGSAHGDGDVPGQVVWAGHKLKAERELLRWLATCSRRDAEVCGRLTIYS